MTEAVKFDVEKNTVGIQHDLSAHLIKAQPDPPIPVKGITFGVATMNESAPHGGEMHPDGDEILYLVSGKAEVELENESKQVVEMERGDAVLVPRGVWHRVVILEPAIIVYLTPGPNNEFRLLESAG